MSGYKSFAVVGGGTIGLPILAALAEQGVSVVLLARPESDPKTVPDGVPIVRVDYADVAALAAAFTAHKVDVVLSTLTTYAVGAQKPLVDAAKLAHVKLFVPSEYGMPTEGHGGLLGMKAEIAGYVKSVGIPSVRFYTGIFSEIVPWLVGYHEHGIVRIIGKGTAPVSFTAVPDIAGFVAHVLTTLPPAELEDRVFRLEGERLCMNDIGALLGTTVEQVESIGGDKGETQTYLLTVMDTGAGSTGWDPAKGADGEGSDAAGSANALWPGHQWKSIKDVNKL
ncbi:hypothetical protein DFH07DRAFT_759717 [Mycena maculata]|uniref:NmrA-like domain-containing protein n=1 Tax=Mycena maculata TaxID=230809 RepID=A0AAD7HLF2_9AGAR|nr:hypothetical protein DFH07DRAFT_759717 [Mycena maculata]